MIGERLLHYEILEKIGEGGMGVVYKALDTHLDRPVAIKVLPPGQTADPERKRRFVQEAKAASALRHPNIVVIHDIASDRGLDFIVMEFVEGATLDRLIGRRALRLSEALATAVQVADGLARAHAAGIVHRDLKPTNIMVTPDGHAKILDFGLAKLLDPPTRPAAPVQATETLPRDEHRTEDGVILGTAAYMAPEQAEGRPADHRADVFAFGAVLYEMLTGRKAFARGSRVATLSAVLRDDPEPLHKLNEAVPPEVETVVQRCLRKDPQRRWQTMSDLKVVLQDLKEDSESGRLQTSRGAGAVPTKKRVLIPLATAALVIVAAAAAAIMMLGRAKPEPASFMDRRLTYDTGLTTWPALSPDGNLFAFASDREGSDNLDLWIQQVNGGQPVRLTDHPAEDGQPAFSPDGSRIAFFSRRDGGGIYVIDALGGETQGSAARLLAKGLRTPVFSPDGQWIACVRPTAGASEAETSIALIPAAGGSPRPIIPDFSLTSSGTGAPVVWSPDGRRVLFPGRREGAEEESGWWAAPVEAGDPVRLALEDLNVPANILQYPVGWTGGWVYFLSGTTIEGLNLYRARLDERSWTVRGPAREITTGPGMKFGASVHPDGRILFAEMKAVIGVWSVPARADEGVVTGPPASVGQDALVKINPTVSRDGRRIAFAFFGGVRTAINGIRLVNTAEGSEQTIPLQGSSFAARPRLSRDGLALAYRDSAGAAPASYLLPEGAASPSEICGGCSVLDFYSDPAFVLARIGPGSLVRMDLRSGGTDPAFETEAGRILDASVSPDDRRLAVLLSGPGDRVSLQVVPAGSSGSPRSPVIIRDDETFLKSPRWSPDGRLLYFLSEMDGDCAVYAQPLDPASGAPAGEPRRVFASPQSRFQMNMPYGGAGLEVARDRLILSVVDITGNIYLTRPARNK